MGFVPVPNVVQIEMLYTQQAEPCENVYHYQFAAPPTASDMNLLIDAMKAWELNHAAALRNVATELTRIRARDLSTQNGVIVDRQVIPTIVGADTTIGLPNNVTVAVSHRTGLGGRSFRGRTFHIGLSDNQVGNNQVLPPTLTALGQVYTLLLAVNPAGSQPLVVVSRRHNKADRAVGIATPVTDIVVNKFIDSQRRRLPEHNRHH